MPLNSTGFDPFIGSFEPIVSQFTSHKRCAVRVHSDQTCYLELIVFV